MSIEPEPFDPIRPDAQKDLFLARRMGNASWLTEPQPTPPLPSSPRAEGEQAPLSYRPVEPRGFFVDFTGHEELLEEFTREAERAGLDPAGSVLDLVSLFVSGDLVFRD